MSRVIATNEIKEEFDDVLETPLANFPFDFDVSSESDHHELQTAEVHFRTSTSINEANSSSSQLPGENDDNNCTVKSNTENEDLKTEEEDGDVATKKDKVFSNQHKTYHGHGTFLADGHWAHCPASSSNQVPPKSQSNVSSPETVQSSNANQEHLDAQCDHNVQQLNNEDTSTLVDDVTSNIEKGTENGSTVFDGQEGEHVANDSNEQTVAQSCDLFSHSTSTRIDVSWSPSQTVESLNVSHFNQAHLDQRLHNEMDDQSTNAHQSTASENELNEDGGVNLGSKKRESNTANDQTVAQSCDPFSPSTSTGRRSNRIALKKKFPTVSTDLNVTKRKKPSANRSVKRSKKTIEDDVGEGGENELDRTRSEQSENMDTRATIEHDDQDNSDGSMPIQQEQSDATNTGYESIATESTANPIQPNRPFHCSHCPKSFDQNSNLQTHLRLHTGERPFYCDQCDKQFTQKAHLEVHQRTHSGQRPFQCKYCDKSFADLSNRNSHEQAIHLHVKPYRCKRHKQCGHTATQRSAVIKHIRVVHFGLPKTIKQQQALNIVDHRDPRELLEKV